MLERVPTRVLQWGMNAVYAGLVSVLPVYAAVRAAVDHKTRSRWIAYVRDMPERFGRRRPRASTGPCVWLHGVSVGEVKAAARLVEVIEETVPDVEVIISVTTDTGRRVAQARYPDNRIEFYPPDFSWIVEDSITALRPDLVILVESEFWPNFLLSAREHGIPVALVNGRMSARSAGRFRKLKELSDPLFAVLRSVCVQLPLYADRFATVGIDRERIHVTGNMKFDNIPVTPDAGRLESFREMFGIETGAPVVVAGSTHPSEERALARMRKRLLDEGITYRLIIAPRHPGRAEAVAQQVRDAGLQVVRRSTMEPGQPPPPAAAVILVDTVGELEVVYALADIVFVGGTLVPHGGQNVMEPASLGKPVVVGPHVHNFRGEVDMLRQVDALVLAADAPGVEGTLRRWLADPEAARAVGERARGVILASKGATERTIEILRPLLEGLGLSDADRS